MLIYKKFNYLKDLRNLLTHRRVPILASNVVYDLPQPSPFRPFAIRGKCINYLPDRPLDMPRSETYHHKKEVNQTLEGLYNFIYETIDDIYFSMAKDLGGT